MHLIKNKLRLIILLLITSFYFTGNKTQAQLCPNSDFSLLNFANWTGCYCITSTSNICYTSIETGTIPVCTPIIPFPTNYCGTTGFLTTSTPTQPSLHTILTPSMLTYPNGNLDSFTNFQLHKIPPGVNQVVRLNSWQINYQTSQLTYTIFVDTTIAGLFVYSYAAVLENPSGHSCSEQPYFQIRLLDAAGNPLNNPCGSFVYVSGAQGTTVNSCTAYSHDINWFNWQTVGLSLKPYHGQIIKIQFIAADCKLSGHFGYAYFYGYCLPRTISIKFCQGTNIATLKAPDGFRYKWFPGGDTTQTKVVVNAVDSAVYTCVVTSFSNNVCTDTLRTLLIPNIIKSNFTFNNACVNMPVNFTHTTTSSANSPIYSWKWDFGDPGSSNNNQSMGTNVSHIYTTPGTYNVKLSDSIQLGCVG